MKRNINFTKLVTFPYIYTNLNEDYFEKSHTGILGEVSRFGAGSENMVQRVIQSIVEQSESG